MINRKFGFTRLVQGAVLAADKIQKIKTVILYYLYMLITYVILHSLVVIVLRT